MEAPSSPGAAAAGAVADWAVGGVGAEGFTCPGAAEAAAAAGVAGEGAALGAGRLR